MKESFSPAAAKMGSFLQPVQFEGRRDKWMRLQTRALALAGIVGH